MYCRFCAQLNNDTAKYCKRCGKETTRTSLTSPVDSSQNLGPNITYAGFWLRLCAFVVDYACIFIILVAFIIMFGSSDGVLYTIFFYGSYAFYHILFLTLLSTTPGKLLFGLKVVKNIDGDRIKFGDAVVRTLAYFLSFVALGLGFFQIAFDKKKHQGWHDRIAKTAVVRGKYHKKSAISVTIISSLLFVWVYTYTSNEDIQNTPPSIRNGTREIKNQIEINAELFKKAKDTLTDTKQPTTSPPTKTDKVNYKFDPNKELAAVVMITCPNDNQEIKSYGSGTIISDTGLKITNYHVIEDSNKYLCEVGLTNNIAQNPEFMYYATTQLTNTEGKSTSLLDKDLDVAILQITSAMEGYKLPDKFPTISYIGSSDKLNINDKIYIAGYPSFGSGTITFTDGVVSGRAGDDFIKTSAKIDSGNSGGAAFNENGEYVGIPSVVFIGDYEGLGGILGIDSIKNWFDANMKGGK